MLSTAFATERMSIQINLPRVVHHLKDIQFMRKVYTLLLIISCQLLSFGEVKFNYSSNEFLVGETGQLTIESNDGKISLDSLPTVTGVKWGHVSSQQSISSINGRTTMSITKSIPFYVLKPGPIVIPPIKAVVKGKEYRSQKLAFTAIKPKEGANKIFTKIYYNGMSTPPSQLFPGETLQFRILVCVAEKINAGAVMPELTINNEADFKFKDYSKYDRRWSNVGYIQNVKSEIIDGTRFQTFTFLSEVTPLKTTTLSGNISILWRIKKLNGRRSRDFWGNIKTQSIQHPLSIDIPEIPVKSLPKYEGDGHVLGLIGRYLLEAKIDQQEVKAGEAVTLSLDIKTNMNFENVDSPKINIDGFRFYNPAEIITDAKKLPHGVKARLNWVFLPLSEKSKLPPITFVTFDSKLKKYNEYTANLPLKILPPETNILAGAVIQGAQSDSLGNTKESLAAVDIIFLKRNSNDTLQIPLIKNCSWVLFLIIIPPIILLIIYLLQKHRGNLDTSQDYRRKYLASKGKAKILKAINSSDDLTTVVISDIVPWLNDISGLPKGTSVDELANHINPELAEIIKNAQMSEFMPSLKSSINKKSLLSLLKKVSCITLFFIMTVAQADTVKATKAYENGNYQQAYSLFLETFKNLQDVDQASAEICYNLGNCEYSLGHYASARAWYERAKLLSPRDSDIEQNLNFTLKKLEAPELAYSPTPLDVVVELQGNLRPDEWFKLAAVLWTIVVITFGYNRLKRTGFPVGTLVTSILLIISVYSGIYLKNSNYVTHRYAIITENNCIAYRIPLANNSQVLDKFLADPGRKMEILEEREVFCRVKLDDADGWVEKKYLTFIWD